MLTKSQLHGYGRKHVEKEQETHTQINGIGLRKAI